MVFKDIIEDGASTPSPKSPLSLTLSLPTPRVCPIFLRMLYSSSPCLAPRTCSDHIIPAAWGTTKSILNSASKHESILGRLIIASLAAAIRGETTVPRVFTER